ncbi:hypothetical protein P700755_001483 [Psychroflexus torquis ATCC 700755]|uniref:Uncharacterized protein n=1 Tax=Psychroflexus torquis (strain ATCC 700755 / CIP 106069 / ACAM 623) TaxID=313595 RepID=K4IEU8_PSYTT|nr:hypothetical protein P700755_001483 [Psychroflexus torquis ATCC 700755]
MALNWLHAVDKMMVDPSESLHRRGLKPPKGALINSLGIERLGESSPRGWQGMSKGVEPFVKFRINFSEPSMRCPRKKGQAEKLLLQSKAKGRNVKKMSRGHF